MKYIKILTLALLSATVLEARTSSAEFLEQGFGAKSVGLGNAYGVVVSDPSAVYWNPAGLAQIYSEKRTTQTIEAPKTAEKPAGDDEEFNKLLEDQNTSGSKESKTVEITERGFQAQLNTSAGYLSNGRLMYFGAAGVSALGGGLAAGVGGTRIQSISTYDAAGNATGSTANNSYAGYLGYGWGSGPVRLGLSGFAVREDLAGGAVNGAGVNVGAQVVVLPPLLAVAADIKNLGAIQSRTNSGFKEVGKLDTLFSFSMQIQAPPPNSNFKLVLGFTANLDKPEGDGVRLNMGMAYGFNKYMYAMLGLNGSRPAIGLGANIGKTFQMAISANRDVLGREFQYFGELNFAF
ncbi:hypothetical protein [Turneriella parva]|uniref:Membrane protein involved in aromatic hydrocarbon degradation n=1 Tax=Turneriella parva (strain ATCC BAA-1111 / DSM 21527 / NCTC 11395 / H) TaxID=869212 RepID=I4B9B9_TURPD|nr:hypothetical protein [Turneriella parva]AFM13876.1 hypothetical protein Turpa_3237 [Turneriella parva DSM 21527]